MPILPPQTGIGFELKNVEAFQAKLPHPCGLLFHFGDFLDDLAGRDPFGLEDIMFFVAEIIFIDFAENVVGMCFGVGCHTISNRRTRHVNAGGDRPP